MSEVTRPEQYLQQFRKEEANSHPENAASVIAALVERKRGNLQIPDINEYCLMWSDLKLETGRGRVPEPIHEMIIHISRGLDFLLFDKLNQTQQGSIREELKATEQEEGTDRLTLTYQEAVILKDAAAVVNVVYDPGKPEESEKRTFQFSTLLSDEYSSPTIVESEKTKK